MPDALIWGASGGIGRALTTHLKQEGWRVFGIARDETRILDHVDHKYEFDAENPDSILYSVPLIAQETDGIDLMVYAAGGIRANPLEKQDPQDWNSVIAANLTGAYLTARSSLNLMRTGGHMMFIGAYVDKITLPRMGAYTSAKAGLERMVTILQKENRKIKITLVRPPAVDTPFWENVPFKLPDGALKPAQVAQAIVQYYEADGSGELSL